MAFSYGQPLTPAEDRYRQLAEAMIARGLNPGITMGGWGGVGQGIGALAQALAGRRISERADTERQSAIDKAMSQIDTFGIDPKYGPLVKALTGMDPMTGLSTAAELATQKPEETWATLTPDEETAAGLDPLGTYQRGSVGGKIDVVNAPKEPKEPKRLKGLAKGGIEFEYDPQTRQTNVMKPDGSGFVTLDDLAGQWKPQASAAGQGYRQKLASYESAGGTQLDNPQSSAAGRYQFMPDTIADLGFDASIINDPAVQEEALTKLLDANAQKIKQWTGRLPNDAEQYAAHRLGAEGARRLYRSSPDTPIQNIVGLEAVTVNPDLKGKTAGQVRSMFAERFGKGMTWQQGQPTRLAAGEGFDWTQYGRGGFSLSPGQVRYDTSGNIIATGPEATAKTHTLSPGQIVVDDSGKVLARGPEKPQDVKTYTLSPGQIVTDARGNIIARGPEKPLSEPDPFTLSPGQTRFDSQGRPIASISARPAEPDAQQREIDRLIALGVPQDIATKSAAGALRLTAPDQFGNVAIIDVTTNKPTGSINLRTDVGQQPTEVQQGGAIPQGGALRRGGASAIVQPETAVPSIERDVLRGTGPEAGISETYANTVGALLPGPSSPETMPAKQNLRQFNQIARTVLATSTQDGRLTNQQMEWANDLLPNPDTYWKDPEVSVNNTTQLREFFGEMEGLLNELLKQPNLTTDQVGKLSELSVMYRLLIQMMGPAPGTAADNDPLGLGLTR